VSKATSVKASFGQSDLWRVCEGLYFPQRFRIRSLLTRRQYQFAVSGLGEMLGRQAVVSDLSDETLVRFVRHLESHALAAKTINERVGRLKTLWLWLWRKGLVRCGPTVEKVPEPIRTPRAWNRSQLESLFAAAGMMPGRVCQFRAAVWWSAFLSVAWFTGERTHALLALRWEWLDVDVLHVPAEVRKGGRKDGLYILPAECLARLVPLSSAGQLIFPWHLTECSFYLHYDRLLRLAGLPTGRAQKVQKIRRSHATWLREAGGDPTRSLLHDSPETTNRHYIDPAICRQPPRLFDPGGNGEG
jgi:integrase